MIDVINSYAMDIKRTIVYGENVSMNVPPRETLDEKHKPIIRFVKEDGTGFGLNEKQLSTGLLLTGETGCGKTSVLCHCMESVMNTMGQGDLMVVLDIKGEFADRFFDPNNKNHIMFCGDGEYLKYGSAWNVFEEILDAASLGTNSVEEIEARIETYAFDMAKTLLYGREGTAQPFFANAAQSILGCYLSCCAREYLYKPKRNIINNRDLVEFFANATPEVYADLAKTYPKLKNYLGNGKNNQALGVLGALDSAINDLFTGVFAEGIGPRDGCGSFSISGLLDKRGGKVLFIEYDLSLADSLESMYRMLFDYLLKGVLSLRNDGPGNVWVILDELRALPGLRSMDRALNMGRGKNLKILASCQSVSQLYTVYSEAEAESLLEGFTNVMCFRSGNKRTRELIEHRSGKVVEDLSYRTDRSFVPPTREANATAIEDWDILSLEPGESYVMLTSRKPFRFQFPFYG